ncbi:hypothetical protein JCM24511_10183 [Saitozyma sp. JCM 24511]|nr:hypothetical protein JCM24511_10183 [Saitozyma sp. JCM 24511]
MVELPTPQHFADVKYTNILAADIADPKGPGSRIQMVSPVPQNDTGVQYGIDYGRQLPRPETLQPTLDKDLPHYKPVDAYSLNGNYTFASSDVLTELGNNILREFNRYYPNLHLYNPPPHAGSTGATELGQGTLQAVFVSRELRPADIVQFNQSFGYTPTSVPIFGGSWRQYGFLDTCGFVVNPSNPLNKLTYKQLDSIFSVTRARGGKPIVTWGDLGLTGEWSNKNITVYGLTPWNGFEEFIRQRVLSYNGVRGLWRSAINTNSTAADPNQVADPNVHWSATIFNLTRYVSEDQYGLAYTGMAYVDRPVKVLSISVNDSGPYFAPSYENVATAEYPLARNVYLNVNKKPGQRLDPVLSELYKFIWSYEGQSLVVSPSPVNLEE